MKPHLRWILTAVIATLIVAGLGAAEWTGQASLDFWNLPALKADIADKQRIAEKLNFDLEEVRRRMSLKAGVIAELAAGRIGFLAAASRFRAINAASDYIADVTGSMSPTASEDERICRNVIAYADSPTAAGRALGLRLRLELLVLKATDRLRLPNLPPDVEDDLVEQAQALGAP